MIRVMFYGLYLSILLQWLFPSFAYMNYVNNFITISHYFLWFFFALLLVGLFSIPKTKDLSVFTKLLNPSGWEKITACFDRWSSWFFTLVAGVVLADWSLCTAMAVNVFAVLAIKQLARETLEESLEKQA